MDVFTSRVSVIALISIGFVALTVTTSAAQSTPQAVDPALTLQCAEWKVRYQKLIEQHEQAGGLSSAARERATDLAYAGYARCVMGGKRWETESAVASLRAIQHVLESGHSVARVDPEKPPRGRRE